MRNIAIFVLFTAMCAFATTTTSSSSSISVDKAHCRATTVNGISKVKCNVPDGDRGVTLVGGLMALGVIAWVGFRRTAH